MILNLSEKIASFFVNSGRLKSEYFEWAVYILQNKILSIAFFTTVFSGGLIFNCTFEILFFLLGLYPLRKRIGGYHAKTPLRCFVTSLILVFICVIISRLFLSIKPVFISILILFFCIATVFFTLPYNHPNMAMSNDELIANHTKAKQIVLLQAGVVLLLIILKQTVLLVFFANGMLSAVISMIAVKIKKGGIKS